MDYSQIVSALQETTIDYTSYFTSLIENQAVFGDTIEMAIDQITQNQRYIMDELLSIKECINTSSSLIVGLILFVGILAGILLGVILWRM